MIADALIPELQHRFSHRGLRICAPSGPIAVFPPQHPDYGELEIYDDGDEVTIVFGRFTHTHLSNYDERLTREEKERQIVEVVVDMLNRLFADRVVVWGSHEDVGGLCDTDHVSDTDTRIVSDSVRYVWSGPLD